MSGFTFFSHQHSTAVSSLKASQVSYLCEQLDTVPNTEKARPPPKKNNESQGEIILVKELTQESRVLGPLVPAPLANICEIQDSQVSGP